MEGSRSEYTIQYILLIKVVNIIILAANVAVLLGWLFAIPFLTKLIPTLKPVSALAACCFILTSITMLVSTVFNVNMKMPFFS